MKVAGIEIEPGKVRAAFVTENGWGLVTGTKEHWHIASEDLDDNDRRVLRDLFPEAEGLYDGVEIEEVECHVEDEFIGCVTGERDRRMAVCTRFSPVVEGSVEIDVGDPGEGPMKIDLGSSSDAEDTGWVDVNYRTGEVDLRLPSGVVVGELGVYVTYDYVDHVVVTEDGERIELGNRGRIDPREVAKLVREKNSLEERVERLEEKVLS